MPELTINGRTCGFDEGANILQVALDNEIEIPHYCYHPELSAPANCRICLADIWAPNPRKDGKLESFGKLLPTCRTQASEGMVVYTDTPKAIANQKSVMEYLLINHPVDCPVCDQAGECHLQDYAYQYGRTESRFEEAKIKGPKKDIGSNVLLYTDRCIMCTRCVRFTREVTGTGELMVDGRGAREQIDVFPGMPLDNKMSGNVVDICPVGALLDKDFLFKERVWFLDKTPSVDGYTASGDNITVEHSDGKVQRIKPRYNEQINKSWISDEIRYSWKPVHDETRLRMPIIKYKDDFEIDRVEEAWQEAYKRINEGLENASGIFCLLSPMISCEDAYWIIEAIKSKNKKTVWGLGPVPFEGENESFPGGYSICSEKAPNARGVRRVANGLNLDLLEFSEVNNVLTKDESLDSIFITGNYLSEWITDSFLKIIGNDRFITLTDSLPNKLVGVADVVLPSATWVEKAGTFENRDNILQAFEQAIEPIDFVKSDAQIGIDFLNTFHVNKKISSFNAADTRSLMSSNGMSVFSEEIYFPKPSKTAESDMEFYSL